MALTMSPLLASSWAISGSIWRSTDLAEPSRPSSAMFSSLGDGLELGDAAAVEQQAQRAEDLLDLGVAAGVARAG